MEKTVVAVLAGGDSSEYEISILGARFVYSVLNKDRYRPYMVHVKGTCWEVELSGGAFSGIDKDDFSFIDVDGVNVRFQYAMIVIHGTPGENGLLQAYFDLMRIPYSTPGVCSCALTFDKFLCKRSVENLGIALAKDILLRKGEPIDVDYIAQKLSLPMFVKANASGSSFGVTKVKQKEELLKAIEYAFTEGDSVIIEEMICGTEISCGIFKKEGRFMILPATEIVPQTEYFDYQAKYKGLSQEITPARITSSERAELDRIMPLIYDRLGCRGVVRIDFILRQGVPFMIEVNTVPGMSGQSLVPQQVKAIGVSMTEFFDWIIEETIKQ